MPGVIYDKVLGSIREGDDKSQYAQKETTPQILTVSDITGLTSEQLNALKAGDIVVFSFTKNIGDKVNVLLVKCSSTYVVANKYTGVGTEQGYCELVNEHQNEITEVVYTNDNDGEGWYFDYSWVRYISTPLVKKSISGSVLNVDPDVMTIFSDSLTGNKTFYLNDEQQDGCAHLYHWRFSTGGTAPNITWPGSLIIKKWAGGAPPAISANKTYEVSVLEGLATIIES